MILWKFQLSNFRYLMFSLKITELKQSQIARGPAMHTEIGVPLLARLGFHETGIDESETPWITQELRFLGLEQIRGTAIILANCEEHKKTARQIPKYRYQCICEILKMPIYLVLVDIHSILLTQSNINPRQARGVRSLLIYISIGCCGYSGKVLIIFLATTTHPAVTIAEFTVCFQFVTIGLQYQACSKHLKKELEMFNGKFPTRDTFCKMPQRDQLRIEKMIWQTVFPQSKETSVESNRVVTTTTNSNKRPFCDGYDIAGNRNAISRAIYAPVMPNTNGIWIYPVHCMVKVKKELQSVNKEEANPVQTKRFSERKQEQPLKKSVNGIETGSNESFARVDRIKLRDIRDIHDIRSVKVQKMEGKHDRGINCSNLLTLEEYERRRRIGTLEEYLKRIRIRKIVNFMQN
ncbi:hypothetical protein APICC_05877 [Apis cerana cerana]|uniref:Uncharacterized protein n=1 Tax=Apis cerana cerana TaxID=94128 RepID=A0A2A3ESJ4_APICC|nr:hypothetical protein APICC_05877 [Apis cerana cerana]